MWAGGEDEVEDGKAGMCWWSVSMKRSMECGDAECVNEETEGSRAALALSISMQSESLETCGDGGWLWGCGEG